MARQIQPEKTNERDESILRAFFRGFFWPLRVIGKGLAWIGHRPPLKQIGHGIRWFFLSKPVRFISLITGVQFIISSWQELKFVTWPTKKESRDLTVAVIIFSVVFGVLIAGVDYGLDKLFKHLLLK